MELKPGMLTQAQKEDMIARGINQVQIYDRRADPQGNYYDQMSRATGLLSDGKEALVKVTPGDFLGIRRNEDELTKILMSRKDAVLDKMNRQILFTKDGRPILDPYEILPGERDKVQPHEGETIEEAKQRMREELAIDGNRQAQIERDLGIQQFDPNEKVEINEDEVSDEDDDGKDDAENKAKKEQQQALQKRLNKKKLNNVKIDAVRQIKALFKLSQVIVQVFSDVRDNRNNHREQGIKDFNSVLGLYNEVLKGWLSKIVKTPVLTILKKPEENLDFVPL